MGVVLQSLHLIPAHLLLLQAAAAAAAATELQLKGAAIELWSKNVLWRFSGCILHVWHCVKRKSNLAYVCQEQTVYQHPT